jgi:hypothetical protein
VAVSFIGEETGVPGENNRPDASYWQKLSHNVVSSTPRHEQGSDCTGSFKFNYHTINSIPTNQNLNMLSGLCLLLYKLMFHTFKGINSLYLSVFFIAFLIQTAHHPTGELSSSNVLVWWVLGMRCDPSYVTWTDYVIIPSPPSLSGGITKQTNNKKH